MIRTRSRSRSRGRSDSNYDLTSGTTRRGTRYSLGGHDAHSPIRRSRRHSVGRMEFGRWTSALESEERLKNSPQQVFIENLIFNISKIFDTTGKKMQTSIGSVLELIFNCLVRLVLKTRTLWPASSPYDVLTAQIDVVSFLWVGFWSLVAVLFFVPSDPKFNVVKSIFRFLVGTFQTTGLLFVLFFMLYLHKMFN